MTKKKKIDSRAKGRRLEYLCRDSLGAWTGLEFQRTPGSGAFGTTNQDMSLIGDVYTKDASFPFCVECKNVEKWNFESLLKDPKNIIFKFWRQATNQAYKSEKKPLLILSKARSPLYFVTPVEHLPKDYKGAMLQYWMPDVQGIGRDQILAIGLLTDLTSCSYLNYLSK